MSTMGRSYYVDARILPEQEDMAPRFSSASGVEQTEYGGQESCLLQAKSSIFAGSWSAISAHPGSTITPTYYASGDSDGMFTRSWALDPVSASLCLTGLPSTAVHYEIKPEPVVGSAECMTLETHTPLLVDIESGASFVDIPETSTSSSKAPEENQTEGETKKTSKKYKRKKYDLLIDNSTNAVI